MQKQLALKIAVIVALGLLVLIPISMVEYKVVERQGYLQQAKSAVAQSWTGEQEIITPVLLIPYRIKAVYGRGKGDKKDQVVLITPASKKRAVVLPDQLTNRVEVTNKSVFKGIYEVPIYDSQVALLGNFSREKIHNKLEKIRAMENFEQLDEPFLSLSISDMRGIDQTPQWQINKTDRLVEPGSQLPGLSAGLHTRLLDMSELEQALTFSIHVSLRGMGQFSFISLADEASTRLKSNWPHPEFIGSSLPKHRDISSAGFTALWNSTQYSSNGAQLIARCLEQGNCVDLRNSSSGVKFIQAVDIYLQTDRSIKYAMLFIGLSFITFFIFEHSKKIRIHPIQYTFVGLAICVFYLLLISLAEHIAFHWAYTIAALCCSVLLLFYVRYMLKSFYLALFFFFMIMGLYALLFVIVQAEDFALLMGAFLVFLVLSVLMVVTRKIDWYTLVEKES